MREPINFLTSVKPLIVCILFVSTFFPLSFSLTPQVNTWKDHPQRTACFQMTIVHFHFLLRSYLTYISSESHQQ